MTDEPQSTKVEMTDRWTLIQRASERDHNSDTRLGVDKILSFDYMGAAEFEFGSVSGSFRAYREQAVAGNLVKSTSKGKLKNGKRWFIIHHKDFDLDKIEAQVHAVTMGKSYTKESTCFDYWLPNCESWWSAPPATVWVVLPHNGDRLTSNNFVIWGVQEKTIKAILEELKQPQPTAKGLTANPPARPTALVTSEDLAIFDVVTIKLRTGAQTPATVVGIHDRCIDVKLPDSTRLKGIPYAAIISKP